MAAFGTYRLIPQQATEMTKVAISAGITHIDTAQLYGNEQEVAKVIEEYKDSPKKIYLTTKIHRKLIKQADKDNRAIENSILQMADCVLLHSPEKNFDIAWEQLCRVPNISVGVSNFDVCHLEVLADRKSLKPAVNQIEVTPFNLCSRTVGYCRKNDIKIEAHSAMVKGELMDSDVMHDFASMYGLTPGQLMIKWSLDQGFVPIFSSKNVKHISEVANIQKSSSLQRIQIPTSCDIGYRTHPQYVLS